MSFSPEAPKSAPEKLSDLVAERMDLLKEVQRTSGVEFHPVVHMQIDANRILQTFSYDPSHQKLQIQDLEKKQMISPGVCRYCTEYLDEIVSWYDKNEKNLGAKEIGRRIQEYQDRWKTWLPDAPKNVYGYVQRQAYLPPLDRKTADQLTTSVHAEIFRRTYDAQTYVGNVERAKVALQKADPAKRKEILEKGLRPIVESLSADRDVMTKAIVAEYARWNISMRKERIDADVLDKINFERQVVQLPPLK